MDHLLVQGHRSASRWSRSGAGPGGRGRRGSRRRRTTRGRASRWCRSRTRPCRPAPPLKSSSTTRPVAGSARRSAQAIGRPSTPGVRRGRSRSTSRRRRPGPWSAANGPMTFQSTTGVNRVRTRSTASSGRAGELASPRMPFSRSPPDEVADRQQGRLARAADVGAAVGDGGEVDGQGPRVGHRGEGERRLGPGGVVLRQRDELRDRLADLEARRRPRSAALRTSGAGSSSRATIAAFASGGHRRERRRSPRSPRRGPSGDRVFEERREVVRRQRSLAPERRQGPGDQRGRRGLVVDARPAVATAARAAAELRQGVEGRGADRLRALGIVLSHRRQGRGRRRSRAGARAPAAIAA